MPPIKDAFVGSSVPLAWKLPEDTLCLLHQIGGGGLGGPASVGGTRSSIRPALLKAAVPLPLHLLGPVIRASGLELLGGWLRGRRARHHKLTLHKPQRLAV